MTTNKQTNPPARPKEIKPNEPTEIVDLNKHPLKNEIIEKLKSGEIILQG